MDRRRFLQTGLTAAGLATVAHGRSVSTGGRVPVRLHSNENPIGLSSRAAAAVREALGECNRYPWDATVELRNRLAALHQVPADAILLGNGSSELLRLCLELIQRRDGMVVSARPTYEAVAGHARSVGVEVREVPLDPSHSHDLSAMRAVVEAHPGGSLVYLCNPNNPTGTITPVDRLRKWISEAGEQTLFVVDEAYGDYADDPAFGSLLRESAERDNVLVTRTFSKIFGMAGLRIGFLVGNVKLVARLSALTRLNVSNLGLVAASASLDDQGHLEHSREVNRQGMAKLCATLEELGLEFLPSHGNFLMFRLNGEVSEFAERMRGEGFLVGRPFPPMTQWCRVSIGLPAEMDEFCRLMGAFRSRGWA